MTRSEDQTAPDPAGGDTGADAADGKREHGRQAIELQVEYKRLNAFFADYTKNISQGGTFIKTERPLDVGTEFVFKLYVPALDEPLSIIGQVVWVLTSEDIDAALDTGKLDAPREPGMGIRFVFADDDERRALERQVEAIMVDSLGQLIYSRLMEQRTGSAPGAPPAPHLGGASGRPSPGREAGDGDGAGSGGD